MADVHVRRSGDDYTRALLQLLPTGQAWPRSPASILAQACAGLADYWGFVDGRAADLLETESDPRATVELLTDWERNWGLPDPCISNPPTALEPRRQNLVAKMTLLGGQSRQYFINLAAQLGYTITITEYLPYMAGLSRVGDTRGQYNPDDPTRYMWQLGPPEIRYNWTVHVGSLSLIYFHCNSSQCVIDRLLAIGTASDLECVLGRYAPAHTKIIYDYSATLALDYTQLFNTQYLALGIM
jgi:uncharacterized protein YmfQ (DUF2313 family)